MVSAGTSSVRRAETTAMAISLRRWKGGPHIPPPDAGAQVRATHRVCPDLAHVSLGSSVTRGVGGSSGYGHTIGYAAAAAGPSAQGGSRTLMRLPSGDFESPASAIPPLGRDCRAST